MLEMDRIDLLKENKDLKEELERHKKALDKACMQLERESMYKVDSDYYGKTSFFNKESWKDWSMKDE